MAFASRETAIIKNVAPRSKNSDVRQFATVPSDADIAKLRISSYTATAQRLSFSDSCGFQWNIYFDGDVDSKCTGNMGPDRPFLFMARKATCFTLSTQPSLIVDMFSRYPHMHSVSYDPIDIHYLDIFPLPTTILSVLDKSHAAEEKPGPPVQGSKKRRRQGVLSTNSVSSSSSSSVVRPVRNGIFDFGDDDVIVLDLSDTE